MQLWSEAYIHQSSGNVVFYNDFFEPFFFQGAMIMHHTSLMTLKKKTQMHKFEFSLDFL